MMKKIILILAGLILYSCKEEVKEKEGNLHLTGKITDLVQGKIYIQKMKDTTLVIEDTIVFNGNDQFETKINIDEPQMLFFYLDRGQTESQDNSLAFFAEPGEMTLNTTLKEFFGQAKVSGSKNQKLYEEFLNIDNQFNNSNLDILKKEFEAKSKNINFNAEKEKNDLMIRRYLYAANFAVNHGNNEISPYLVLYKIPDASIKILEEVDKALTPKIKKSKYGKIFSKYLEERKKEGV